MICKNYFPFYRLSFHFLIVTFKAQQFLNLMMPIIYFFPSACAFAVNFTKILHQHFLQEYNSFITSLNYLAVLGLNTGSSVFSATCRVSWLQCADFLVAACMWDLVPRPGIEPRLPTLGLWTLTPWTTMGSPYHLILVFDSF